MEHTAGPWELVINKDELLITSKVFGAITSIPVGWNHPSIIEHTCNAQLIASAPKLKEALENLCYTLSDNEIPQSQIKKAYERAQKVLKQLEK